MGPARTPADVLGKINDATTRALDNEEVRTRLRALELEPYAASPAAFAAFIRDEIPVWGKFIKDSGLKVEF